MELGMTFITAALITYTIAVWGEQITKELKPAFVVMFCVGVICDTTGTLLMTLIETSPLGLFETIFHIVTGAAAIFLMLIHAVWAIKVLIQKDEMSAARFHKFSKFVWLFWLVPFLSPMFTGMMG
ncbi:MAG: TIGR03987 family protein [Candidatus Thorarchaeota archaeon]|nr:MAG: TIGR03987 family protein [Candidatus Thorarchaeota archaeon]